MNFFWLSAVLVVFSNVIYHVSQKSIPAGASPIVSVIVTFVTALILCLVILPFFSYEDSLITELKKLNWTSVLVGVSIIGIEIGYLLFYRSGWDISLGPVFCYALVTICLIPIGILFFKEHLSLRNYIGIVITLIGIYLITNKKS
jgi:drug/metabolite transporter (DMT)-like permease